MIGSPTHGTLTVDTVAGPLHRFRALLGEGFRSRPARRGFRMVLAALVILFPWALVFNVTGLLVDEAPWSSSLYILLIAAATLLSELRARPARTVLMECLLLAAVLWGVEQVGVSTGIPFGNYSYSSVLGLLIAQVPLAIPFAWYATIVNGRRIAEHLAGGVSGLPTQVAVIAGILTFALDLVLEPMAAMVKGYWRWSGDVVPAQNYAFWVAITAAAVFLIRRTDDVSRAGSASLAANALVLFGMQWAIFVATGVAHGHAGPVAASAVILAALVFVRGRHP
jgi:putative membrane protein